MCGHYTNNFHDDVLDELRVKFDWKNFHNLKDCLLAIEPELRKVKGACKQMRRDMECTSKIDTRKRRLKFAAWVLNVSRKDEQEGKAPWLNGGQIFI